MNNSIEIKSRTLLFMLLALVCFSLMIFSIDMYDKNQKKNKLETMLSKLEKLKSEELKTTLLEMNLDSLSEKERKDIKSHFSILDRDKEFNALSNYGMKILIKDKEGYHTLDYKSINYPPNSRYTYDFIHSKNLYKKEEDIINALEKSNANVNAVIIDNFSFTNFDKVIYPLAKNENKSAYLYFSYIESN